MVGPNDRFPDIVCACIDWEIPVVNLLLSPMTRYIQGQKMNVCIISYIKTHLCGKGPDCLLAGHGVHTYKTLV
jgi:hypothetical protein